MIFHHKFVRPLLLVLAYAAWVVFFRLISLSILTFFSLSPNTTFQDISDRFGSNEVSLMGLIAFLFILFMCQMRPITRTQMSSIVSRRLIEKQFLPGFAQGSIWATVILLFFILSGMYRYLGYFIPLRETAWEILNIVLRMIVLVAFIYFEEFIFRHKLVNHLKALVSTGVASQLIALSYCGIKLLQFDLGVSHLITLYLVSVALYYRASPNGNFARGAGIWSALLVVFHSLFSLPIFGNQFAGVILLKFQGAESSPGYLHARMLSGGAGGPVASFVLQLLLILDIGRSMLRGKHFFSHD